MINKEKIVKFINDNEKEITNMAYYATGVGVGMTICGLCFNSKIKTMRMHIDIASEASMCMVKECNEKDAVIKQLVSTLSQKNN